MANKQIEEFPLVPTPESGDILHISRGGADRSISVENLVPSVGTSGAVIVDRFVDGVDYTAGTSNALNISQSLVSKRNAWVFFGGIYQEKITYEINGSVVVFDDVIPVGTSSVEIVMPLVLAVGEVSADNVQFSTNGSVEDLLSQTIVFPSVQAMIDAAWLQVGYKCVTLGYTAAGDGGDNDYQITAATGTPDAYKVIALTASGNQALGLFTKGYRSPKQGGATSDVASLPSGNATPSVERGDYYVTSGTTTITNFIEGREGQTIHIQATAAITIQNNANIVLSDGADYVMAAGDVLVITQYVSGVWTEEARGSVGGGGAISVTDGTTTVNPTTTLNFGSNYTVTDAGAGQADVNHSPAAPLAFDDDVAVTFGTTAQVPIIYTTVPGPGFLIGDTISTVSLSGAAMFAGAADGLGNQAVFSYTGVTNSIVGLVGPQEFINADYDGTNTSVSIEHNGNSRLVVDENGVTFPFSGSTNLVSIDSTTGISIAPQDVTVPITIGEHSSTIAPQLINIGVKLNASADVRIGFFGATAVARPQIDSSDTDTNRITALENALVALGLVEDIAP